MSKTLTVLILTICFLSLAIPAAAEYTPDPDWKIAFIRGGNLWMMAADGSGARELYSWGNVGGRLSWSTDGKRICYSRQGQVTVEYPDGTGGGHKCYNIQVAHIDSAGKNFWWYITNDLGSMFPEWSDDDQLFVYVYDVGANQVNSLFPEYRIRVRNWNGSLVESVTPEDKGPGSFLGIQPTISPDKKLVAYIHMERKKDKATALREYGMVIVPRSGVTRTEEELRQEAAKFAKAGCPTFSPDGASIAYISKDTRNPGIYLVNVATRTKMKVFTPPAGLEIRPNAVSWSPDGRWLTFSSYDGNIYVVGVDGKDLKQLSFGGNDYHPAFSK